MKISIKVLCVGLMTALSLGSVFGMRPAGRTRRGRGRQFVPVQVVRQPQMPIAPQVAPDQELKDYEIAFALQLKEAQEESALEAQNEQLKRDEAYARSLQDDFTDGENDLSNSYDDEDESQQDIAAREDDEAFARSLQQEYDAENAIPQALLHDAPAPAPQEDAPVMEEDGECVLCNERQANVWLMCCNKKDVCYNCITETFKRDIKCPFCRKPKPEVVPFIN